MIRTVKSLWIWWIVLLGRRRGRGIWNIFFRVILLWRITFCSISIISFLISWIRCSSSTSSCSSSCCCIWIIIISSRSSRILFISWRSCSYILIFLRDIIAFFFIWLTIAFCLIISWGCFILFICNILVLFRRICCCCLTLVFWCFLNKPLCFIPRTTRFLLRLWFIIFLCLRWYWLNILICLILGIIWSISRFYRISWILSEN